jgi:sodium/bile acid cotransporter 7
VKRLILPLGLALAFLLAWLEPAWGQALKEAGLIPWLVMIIFLVNGWQVRLAQVPREASFVRALLATGVISLLLGPWLGLQSAQLLGLPAGALVGLVVIATVPPTLSSCIVLTQLVGGFAVWALILSLALNLVGVLSMPFMLSRVLEKGDHIRIDTLPLLRQLSLMVLLPFLIGLVLQSRLRPDLPLLQYLPPCCIAIGVWLAMSDSAAVFHDFDLPLLLTIALAAMSVHLVLLGLNWWAGRLLGVPREGRIAMALAGSQKTLPVAISLLAMLEGPVGEALLVCVMFHFLTLFADALIAPSLARPGPASDSLCGK